MLFSFLIRRCCIFHINLFLKGLKRKNIPLYSLHQLMLCKEKPNSFISRKMKRYVMHRCDQHSYANRLFLSNSNFLQHHKTRMRYNTVLLQHYSHDIIKRQEWLDLPRCLTPFITQPRSKRQTFKCSIHFKAENAEKIQTLTLEAIPLC